MHEQQEKCYYNLLLLSLPMLNIAVHIETTVLPVFYHLLFGANKEKFKYFEELHRVKVKKENNNKTNMLLFDGHLSCDGHKLS